MKTVPRREPGFETQAFDRAGDPVVLPYTPRARRPKVRKKAFPREAA
jgi:hypothetical protein